MYRGIACWTTLDPCSWRVASTLVPDNYSNYSKQVSNGDPGSASWRSNWNPMIRWPIGLLVYWSTGSLGPSPTVDPPTRVTALSRHSHYFLWSDTDPNIG